MSFKRIQHREKKAKKRMLSSTESSAEEKNDTKGVKKQKKKSKSSDETGTPVGDNPLKQFYTSQSRYEIISFGLMWLCNIRVKKLKVNLFSSK